MKITETREIAIGVTALTLLAVILALFYSGRYMQARVGLSQYRIYAVFNHIDGLYEGAEVRVSGIPVGSIETVSLDPNYRARVSMLISRAIPLPLDSSARIETDGLFGQKHVAIEPGGDEKELGDGDTLSYAQDSIIVSELLDLVVAEGRALRAQSEQKARPDKKDN